MIIFSLHADQYMCNICMVHWSIDDKWDSLVQEAVYWGTHKLYILECFFFFFFFFVFLPEPANRLKRMIIWVGHNVQSDERLPSVA